MKIHALTLTWNGQDKLEKLSPTFFDATKDLNAEVIWYIRDNGSKDDTLKYLESEKERWGDNLKVLDAGHNRESFAGGVNSLWKMADVADDDIILMLNNDIVFNDTVSVQKILDLHKKTKADVVGCRLLFENTTKLQHAGVIYSKKYGLMPFHYRPSEESDAEAEKDRYFQSVTAAFCLVTGSSFNKIGGMDEGFKWAFDDIDMCMQIRANGGKIAYCGSTNIYHEESATLKKNPVNKMFQGPNVERFRKKWSGKYEIDHDLYLGNPSYNVIK